MCRQLGVARSSLYAWRACAGTVTATQAHRDALKPEIQRVFTFLWGAGGCRRVAALLNAQGIVCSVGLAAIQPRAYQRTTITDDQAQIFDDHLERNFAPEKYVVGQAFVSDITYLKTGEGWVYITTITDVATRMVVGWQLADHMRSSLVIDALQMAQTQVGITRNALIHSDHGTQGVSIRDTEHLAAGLAASVGAAGDAYDNALAETVNGLYKAELIYARPAWPSATEVEFQTMNWVHWWNTTRLHEALDYQTPTETEASYHMTQAQALSPV